MIRLSLSDNGIGFNTNLRKKIGLQNMISRTQECNGILMFPLPKGRKHNNGYNSNRTNTSIKIKMTVEPDSLTRLSNKILIVDDHPLLFKDTRMASPGINQKSTSFIFWKPKIVSQPII
jgi:hypothetical protein